MLSSKRWLVMAVVMALAFSALSVMAVNAQDDQPAPAWLGVIVIDTDAGATIRDIVPDSPAEAAGLQQSDIIQAVDGNDVESADALVEMVQAHAPGDELVLTVERDGEAQEVTVTLVERPEDMVIVNPPMEPHEGLFFYLGLDISVTDDGVQIDAISEDSPLADSGLQVGDVITEVNGQSVLEVGPGMMRDFRLESPVVFTVLRDGEEIEIEVEFDLPSVGFDVMPMQPSIGFGYGQATQPTQLGVQFRTLTPDFAAEKELTVEQGALIVEVFEGTPAAEAGLQVDDIITAVSGDVLDEERTLADRLVAYEEGDVVTLSVLRGEEEMEIDVTLGPRGPQPMMFFGNGNFGGNMPFGGEMMPDMMPHMGGFFGHWFMGPQQGGMFGGRHGQGGMFQRHHGQGMFQFHFGPVEVEPVPEGPDA